jgi:hypothetical protein
VLNGVGGCTIAEAQERITYPEFIAWARYRAKRGSLHPGLRIERSTALLASMYANAHSKHGGYGWHDFAPYHDEPEVSLDDAMDTWH